jgi:ABC-2 type transport system permease protein
MNLRIILAIAQKDIVDAIRNTYILFSLVLPVGMSLLFAVILPDGKGKPLDVIVYDPGQSRLVSQLQGNPALRLVPVDSESEVAKQVKDLVVGGLAIPAGFDAAVADKTTPSLPVSYNGGRSAVEIVALRQALEEALRAMAGQSLPAKLALTDVTGGADALEGFNLSSYYLVLLLVLGLTMVGVFVLPTILVEEKERNTLRAILTSPASYADVVLGKALVGLLYALLVSGILMAANNGFSGNVPVTLMAVVLGSLLMVQIGLLMGAVFQTSMQVNTWSSIIMLLLLLPSMFNMPPRPPEPLATIARLIPTSYLAHAVTLSIGGQATLESVGLDLVIMAACTVVAFLLVVLALRRERA